MLKAKETKKNGTAKAKAKPLLKVDPAQEAANEGAENQPKLTNDPVFAKYGEPFITDEKGKVHLNERAVAAKCATEHTVKYNAALKNYQRFDTERGLWHDAHEVEVRRLIGDLLLKLGEDFGHQEFVRRNKNSQFNALCKMLQPYHADVNVEDTTGLLHVSNGVLDLRGASPKLLKHDPKFPFGVSPGIKYDPKAKCGRFEKELLQDALGKDDIRVVQKYCGSILLGANTCHGILLIRGTPGGGKSTLISIIEKIIGEENVAHLRTKHLNGRFETSAFIGKRLLVGKDVPGDTLKENGARLLKSLVGGDLLQAEIKYNPAKQKIRGDFHVIIASNNRLRIALDGDEKAWERRLRVVDFQNPKPSKPIPHFAEVLVAEEASGILNWLIEGALVYREEMKKTGILGMTPSQQERVSALIEDSDSVRSFVEERVVKDDEATVSSEELLLAYYALCESERWTPVGEHAFQKLVPDILLERFKVCRRNDIRRGDKGTVRGYKHIRLN